MNKKWMTTITAIIAVIVIFGILYYVNNRTLMLKEILSDNLNAQKILVTETNYNSNESIDGIERKEIDISDKEKIKALIDLITQMEVKKGMPSNIDYNESYWITIKENNNLKYGFTLFDNKYIEVYTFNPDTPKKQTQSFTIVNDVDISLLKGLFSN